MEQPQLFKIRDRRKKGWFFMDNEYLNGYARIFGAIGTAIYVSLCRHVNNETQTCFPSMDLISEELTISRPTIIKYLKKFEEYKIIAITKEKDFKGRQKNNVYLLLDKEEWTPSKDILLGEPSKAVLHTRVKLTDKSRVKPVYHKDTNVLIKETHIKDTLSAKADEVWSFDKFFKEMEDHKRRDFQIMALYWEFKKIRFTNKEQAYGEIKRLLRAGKELVAFEDEKIYRTMEWLERNADFAWKLETVRKFITEDLSKLKSFKK